MKKSILFVLALAFAFILLPHVLAEANIAYIVSSSSRASDNVMTAIENTGYSYEVIDDDHLPANFNDYDMIIVGESAENNLDKIPVGSKEVLVENVDKLKDLNLAEYSSFRITTGYEYGMVMTINSITENMSSLIPLYNQPELKLNYLPKGSLQARGFKNIVAKNTYDQNSIIASIDIGGKLYNGDTTSKRTLFFGLVNTGAWTNETQTLFERSITWVMIGEDKDKDGFYGETDCNDNNADVNPDATEIPYDGIDNNCDGVDIADVDGDGYCKAGYVIQNKALQCPNEVGTIGTDCNDADSSVNSGAQELVDKVNQNCVNDAPIFSGVVNDVSWNEDSNAVNVIDLKDYFTDPDGDNLTYGIENTSDNDKISLIIHNSIVSFYSSQNWNGNDYIVFNAVDSNGSKAVTNRINLTVNPVNNAPTLVGNIDNVSWDEDSQKQIDLAPYFNDIDSNLTYDILNNDNVDATFNGGVVTLTPKTDWNGNETVRFVSSDGEFNVNSNDVVLTVNNVNDAPTLFEDINSLNWDENTNLTEAIDLNGYFADIDSNLTYSVRGNTNINVTINDGIVNFSTPEDWNGNETIIFTTSDGEFNVDSNPINLTVNKVNKAPVFDSLTCQTDILEDNGYNCELSASDFENDSFTFSVVNQNNINCNLNGTTLTYAPNPNFFGLGSCLLKVSDGKDSSTKLLDFNISNVNDPPTIVSFDPVQHNVTLLVNEDKRFSINARDIDPDMLDIKWFLDGNFTKSGSGYSYDTNVTGEHELSVTVSDGKIFQTNVWSVVVKDKSDLTCAQQNGNLCNANQTCNGIISASDGVCCSVACTDKIELTNIQNRCLNSTGNIDISIKKPTSDDSLNVGDKMDVKLSVDNNLDNKLVVKLESYLYDLTTNKIVDKKDGSLNIDKNDKKESNFTFSIPLSSNEGDKYALYTLAKDSKSLYCDEDIVKLDLQRSDYDVGIKDLSLDSTNVCKTGQIKVDATIENKGAQDQEVYLNISSDVVNKETEKFDVGSYGNSNMKTKSYLLDVNKDKDGVYPITFDLYFNDGKDKSTVQKQLDINCTPKEIAKEELNPIAISVNNTEASVKETGSDKKALLFIVVNVFVLLLVALYLLNYVIKFRA